MLQFALAFNVVLTADEIPHEITPVHPVALVADEEPQVLCESGLVDHLRDAVDVAYRDFVALNHAAPVLAVGLVHRHVFGLVAPHAGEQCLHLRWIFGHGVALVVSDHITACFFVFDINRLAVGGVGDRCIIIWAVQQRPRSILLTVQVGEHGKGVLGLIFINRRIGVGTDHQHEEG